MLCACKFEKYKQSFLCENYEQTFLNKKDKTTKCEVFQRRVWDTNRVEDGREKAVNVLAVFYLWLSHLIYGGMKLTHIKLQVLEYYAVQFSRKFKFVG